MPTDPLPQNPDLDQLRKQARELQRAKRVDEPGFALSSAQLLLARRYGFPSWVRLRRHVEIVKARTWNPSTTSSDTEPLPDRYLRLVCLTYSSEPAADLLAAAELLAEHPELPAAGIATAAACADVARVREILAADPAAASTPTGPHGWTPLLYQAYARPRPAPGRDATLRTARLLLEAGADPNDGRFWHGLPTPFTVLTGVLGHGEGDQPAHAHAIAFARLLLEAGADPNDGQALYNRMFRPDDGHLVLLFEFGLGRGDGGPWHRLLPEATESPAVMLRNLLWWAITHDQRERVALLAAHGVDVSAPFTELRMRGANGATPLETALTSGHTELAEQLTRLGAVPRTLDPVDAFVAAALAGDGEAVCGTDPDTVAAACEQRPGLVTWAAAQGAPDAFELLVAAGFDVNSLGRSDAPIDQPWESALHVAAQRGDRALAQRLLELGADPGLRDRRFGGTALDWARHFDQPELIELLER